MRVAIMAAGAVGGYFGARIAQAGHDVIFFAAACIVTSCDAKV
jgi:2-dehydropantoate 2-reductase